MTFHGGTGPGLLSAQRYRDRHLILFLVGSGLPYIIFATVNIVLVITDGCISPTLTAVGWKAEEGRKGKAG
jgi:hypothetical protein